MDAFQWNDNYITGIDQIDEQHKNLVRIINLFSRCITSEQVSFEKMDQILSDLLHYTDFHFRDEEALMIENQLDPQYIGEHVEKHNYFISEIKRASKEITKDNVLETKYLLEFLVNWLIYHILGTDKLLAAQIKLIQTGKLPGDVAIETQSNLAQSSTEPLLNALNWLFEMISERNRQLTQLNQTLEQIVEERTEQLQKANLYLEELSLTDPLTGIANRRRAIRQIDILWNESNEKDKPLSCIMIDVDHFKEVNDVYGHDIGDILLKKLTGIFSDTIRSDDLVCRLGGDEFMVICPKTDLPGSLKVADNIHKNVNEFRMPTGDSFWQGSISVGVATRNPEMISYEELIKAADQAVYQAKRDGKNCIRHSLI